MTIGPGGIFDLINAGILLIKAETDKIDNLSVSGLLGVKDSLAYKVNEIERHFHNIEHWVGSGAVEFSLTPYQLTSGNADFGTEVLLLDTTDTPFIAGNAYFDVHRIFVNAFGNNTIYWLQLVWGTGTFADALSAGQESAVPVRAPSVGSVRGSPVDIKFPRIAAGTKVWARCKNATNLATLDIFPGLHEYEG